MERIKKLISYINEFANCTVEDNIGMYAAQASFFLIISAIPFMMLMLAVLQFIIPFSESDIIHLINQYMPSKIVPWVEDITNEIFNNSSLFKFRFSSLFISVKNALASLLAPPRPAPLGIFFIK